MSRPWFVGHQLNQTTRLNTQLSRERAIIRYLEVNVASKHLGQICLDLRRHGRKRLIEEAVWRLQDQHIISLQHGVIEEAKGAPLPPLWGPIYQKMWALVQADPWISTSTLAMRSHTTTHRINMAIHHFVMKGYMWRSKYYWLADGWEARLDVYMGALLKTQREMRKRIRSKMGLISQSKATCWATSGDILRAWCEVLVWTHACLDDARDVHEKAGNKLAVDRYTRMMGVVEFARDQAQIAFDRASHPDFPALWLHRIFTFRQNTTNIADKSNIQLIYNGRSALHPLMEVLRPMTDETGLVGDFRDALISSTQHAQQYIEFHHPKRDK